MESDGAVGHSQVEQHTYYGSTRGDEGKGRREYLKK